MERSWCVWWGLIFVVVAVVVDVSVVDVAVDVAVVLYFEENEGTMSAG